MVLRRKEWRSPLRGREGRVSRSQSQDQEVDQRIKSNQRNNLTRNRKQINLAKLLNLHQNPRVKSQKEQN